MILVDVHKYIDELAKLHEAPWRPHSKPTKGIGFT